MRYPDISICNIACEVARGIHLENETTSLLGVLIRGYYIINTPTCTYLLGRFDVPVEHVFAVDELQGNGHLNCPTHDVVYCVFEIPATLMENWRGEGG